LRETHVLLLSLLLSAAELVELLLHKLGPSVVLFVLVADAQAVQDLEEADDFVVGEEVNASLWEQGSILALVTLVELHLVLLLLADGLVAAHA